MSDIDIKDYLDDLGAGAFKSADILRAALVPKLRVMLDDGLKEAERLLIREHDGLACARRLSAMMDRVVHIAYEAIVNRLYVSPNPSSSERIAIIATGGYGRGTLGPGSDVDLLFLLPYKQTAWGEGIVETMLYLLWDLKLKVGHATRLIDDCIREGKADITVRTSLLEARFLFGDRALFDELEARFKKEIIQSTAAEFVEAKLKERDERIARVGASRYLVEPNVKDGKGGLRDLHTLFWIVKYVYGTVDPQELIKLKNLTEEEASMAVRCTEFLWRVRCHMHFVVGRGEEKLTFDLQPVLAERMGFSDRGGLSAVERFMKSYFLVAKEVGDLTAALCADLEARQAKKRPLLDRIIGPLRRRRQGSFAADGFFLDNGRINVKPDVFSKDQVNFIRLFWMADHHNLAIHPDAKRLASRHAKEIGPSLRKDEEANSLFLDVLTSRNSPEIVLRTMNEAGVLGRFIPDFARIVAMMQFNMYHHYTVDEHLLRCIGVISELENGSLGNLHPVAHSIFKSIRSRRALYVAAFLHDIAKGRPEDHSEAGAVIARKLGQRFGLDRAEVETVVWLVRYHLLMSDTAQRRDISDPMTIKNFAGVVQTMERLKLLLVLTIADITAVGQGVWTGWKGELLRALYYETELAFGGELAEMAHSQRVELAKQKLREDLPDWSDDAFKAYAARHSASYWTTVEHSRRVKHARFVAGTEAKGWTVATDVETDHFRGATELMVLSPDHPRLLTIITGACAAAGANIVDAKIFTTNDGMALDTIVISRAFDRDDDELRRAQRIAKTIENGLKGEIRIDDLVSSRKREKNPTKAFRLAPEVSIDNSLASRQTVLEVSGLDRPGLLYELTSTIGKLNLNIASAHIATFGEKAVDAFYVTDLLGTKIVHPSRQNTIRKALLEVFSEEKSALTGSRGPSSQQKRAAPSVSSTK